MAKYDTMGAAFKAARELRGLNYYRLMVGLRGMGYNANVVYLRSKEETGGPYSDRLMLALSELLQCCVCVNEGVVWLEMK